MATRIAARNSAHDLSPHLNGDKKIVVVFTANSNTGFAATQSLLKHYAGKVIVRAVVRKMSNLPPPRVPPALSDHPDVQVIIADVRQKGHLDKVFDGCKVAYWATPPTTDRLELTKLFIEGCISHGVDYPIILSMVRAGDEPHHLKDFGLVEDYCWSKMGTKTDSVKDFTFDTGGKKLQPTILRCGQFFENLYGVLPAIKAGTLYFNLGLEGSMPQVALSDVGDCIAAVAMNPQKFCCSKEKPVWNLISKHNNGGKIARAFTMASVGTKYEPVEAHVMIAALTQAGMKRDIAEKNVEVIEYYANRWQGSNLHNEPFEPEGDVQEILGRPPTTLLSFAKATSALMGEKSTVPPPWAPK
eukprot:m.25977 g.25977  ORF g.25977 m.25977 type:complete len:357 (+) comp15228_c0_seq1:100-1170(+)